MGPRRDPPEGSKPPLHLLARATEVDDAALRCVRAGPDGGARHTMRLLADNPSMDYLRREAKDVLHAQREHDDKANLADAQQALATEYGFRSWSDLKAEVDRRRRDVPRPPDGLAEDAAEAFGLGAVASPMTPIRYEYMGRRWALDTERGRFMLSPVFDWI